MKRRVCYEEKNLYCPDRSFDGSCFWQAVLGEEAARAARLQQRLQVPRRPAQRPLKAEVPRRRDSGEITVYTALEDEQVSDYLAKF